MKRPSWFCVLGVLAVMGCRVEEQQKRCLGEQVCLALTSDVEISERDGRFTLRNEHWRGWIDVQVVAAAKETPREPREVQALLRRRIEDENGAVLVSMDEGVLGTKRTAHARYSVLRSLGRFERDLHVLVRGNQIVSWDVTSPEGQLDQALADALPLARSLVWAE